MPKKLKLFSGNINRPLAEEICAHLDCSLGKARVAMFPGGETDVQIQSNVRGRHVFVMQSICASADGKLSPNDALMELLLLIDAAKRASAKRVTAVLPYYGYARQDRKDKPRTPISAKVVADAVRGAGAKNIITLDLHSNQIQGFFDIPVNHVYVINQVIDYIKQQEWDLSNTVIASPDVGGIKMARAYAEALALQLAIVDKRRSAPGKIEVMNVIGNIAGKDVLFVDDLVATAGSLCNASAALKKKGAHNIRAAAVHPVLAGNASETINNSPLCQLLVTNSIPLPNGCGKNKKIAVVSIAPFLAEVIKRVYDGKSVSSLFNDRKVEG